MCCSICKNRFYCGPECIAEDWKKHRYNCSLLPDESLEPAAIVPSDELDVAVRHVGEIIQVILEDWREREIESHEMAPATAEDIKARQETPAVEDLIEFELPEGYAYLPIQEDMNPLQHALLSFSRLFLIHELSYSSDEDKTRLVEQCDAMKFPSTWPQLYGPKIVARPADLSDGEYDMLLSTMPVYFVGDEERLFRGEETWFPLCAVSKGLRG